MTTAIESVLRRDRAILIVSLVTLTLLAWTYVINLSFRMPDAAMNSSSSSMDMDSAQMAMPNVQAWQVEDILFTLYMWAVMMVAMMTPSAAPMILTFAGLNRQRHINRTSISPTAAFLVGYLIVWISFSAGATFVQWGFHLAGLLSPETIS